MNSDERNRCSHRLGFPIRKSPDHRLLASSRSLSQLTTSFIASLRQGIHTHALSSLTIKSISNTKFSQPRRTARGLFDFDVNSLLRLLSSGRQNAPTFGERNTCSKYCPSDIQFSKNRRLDQLHRRRRKSPFGSEWPLSVSST